MFFYRTIVFFFFFFFNDTATTEIYTLSLHDALPILEVTHLVYFDQLPAGERPVSKVQFETSPDLSGRRSEEHTSELQSRRDLVCRLLLEKKKKKTTNHNNCHRNCTETQPIDIVRIIW